MSTETLRDLLHDRVADETAVDLSARAWRAGRRVRRRRGLAVAGGVTAGAVAASGGIAWVGSTPPSSSRGAHVAPAVTSSPITSPTTFPTTSPTTSPTTEAAPVPGRPSVPCDGTSSLAGLLRGSPRGTIAVRADVTDAAPAVTSLAGVEVEAVYPLRNVTQVAGPPTTSVPREVSAVLAAGSVPVFLQARSYLLLLYPSGYEPKDTVVWSVLGGVVGEFEIAGTGSARQRCMVPGLRTESSPDEVLAASDAAPRGPVEPLDDVIAAIERALA